MNVKELIEKHAKIIGCPENDGPPSQSWVDAGVKNFAVELLEGLKSDAEKDFDSRKWESITAHCQTIDKALEELRK